MAMKQIFLLVIFILLRCTVNSQGVLFLSPDEQGIGKTGALSTKSWSFFTNPAGIASTNAAYAGIGYFSGFNIKELSSRAAFASVPTSLLTGAAGFTHFGYEHFSIQQYSLAAARQMAPWLRLGIRFNYFIRHQTNSENYGISTLDAGLQINPDPKVSVGFFTVNPARVEWKLPDWNEYQPSGVAAAVAYKPVATLKLELGLLKNSEYPAETSFAIEAPIHKLVTLRGAATTEPLRLGFGGGLEWEYVAFDIGFNHHSTLGFTSSFGLLFNFNSLFQRNSLKQ